MSNRCRSLCLICNARTSLLGLTRTSSAQGHHSGQSLKFRACRSTEATLLSGLIRQSNHIRIVGQFRSTRHCIRLSHNHPTSFLGWQVFSTLCHSFERRSACPKRLPAVYVPIISQQGRPHQDQSCLHVSSHCQHIHNQYSAQPMLS